MEVLAACLTNDPGVSSILVKVVGNILPQLLEDEGASSEVEGRELAVTDRLCDDFSGRARDELDDASRQAGFS
jgi:hypothetical protein